MGDIRKMWMNINELGKEIGYTTKTVYKIRSESPERLPKSFRLPGSSRVVYLRDDVENWLKKAAQTGGD